MSNARIVSVVLAVAALLVVGVVTWVGSAGGVDPRVARLVDHVCTCRSRACVLAAVDALAAQAPKKGVGDRSAGSTAAGVALGERLERCMRRTLGPTVRTASR